MKELRIIYDTDWEKITAVYNKEFRCLRTINALKIAHSRYSDIYETTSKDQQLAMLSDLRRSRKTASKRSRDNDLLVENHVRKQDIVDSIKSYINSQSHNKKQKIVKKKLSIRAKKLHNMTIELLLSDLHYGRLSNEFNAKVARDRMCQLIDATVKEVDTHSKLFNIDRIIVAMMGDMIESYTMHGLESAMASEMANSEQIVLAITSLMEDALIPLLELGYPIYVPCVTGNHDRTEREKTYNLVGRNNVTWIIYNTLEMLCKSMGYNEDNIKFEIAESPYIVSNIYHNKIMWEHGDNIKNTNKKTIEDHIAKRQKQISEIIDFFRMGHYHEFTLYEQGRIMINGCLTGQDGYADVWGFNTHACQILNFYVETKDRPNCFYKSFPVQLN